MEYSKDCPFCMNTRFKNNKLVNLPSEECILFENNNIYVQVDISPLCRGHILIITKEHYLNFYETPDGIKKDTKKIMNTIIKLYRELYNSDTLFFEHGSAKSGYAGASIDHAHLHCVPYNSSINNDLDKLLGKAIECDIFAHSTFKNEFSYIYTENSNNKKIYKVEKLPSQFLRKLMSEKINDGKYLWQEKCITNDSIDTLNQTINDLKNKIII